MTCRSVQVELGASGRLGRLGREVTSSWLAHMTEASADEARVW